MDTKKPIVLSRDELQRAYNEAPTAVSLARKLGISKTCLYRLLSRHNIERTKLVRKIEIV